MYPNSSLAWRKLAQRCLATLLLGIALVGCGGSGGGGEGDATDQAIQSRSIRSRLNGTEYPLRIYAPPGDRSSLPIVYVLDGDSWFDTLVTVAGATNTRLVIVGIGNAGLRDRDFVPSNRCTPIGGGHAAYFDFLRQELLPYVEEAFGGDPRQRVLFGHSHGGSFVLYAMFSQPPGQHAFKTYLASDSSVSCMPETAIGWEQAYASAHLELPVRLHMSYATLGNEAANIAYADVITQRAYQRLAFVAKSYTGTHGGIVPQALLDGIAFATANP